MTDIEIAPPTSAPPALRTPVDLATFANEAHAVHQIAQALARSSFVPETFRGRPDEITAAILYGREIGVTPMMALQIINPIQGRPTISANGMRGLAMGHGVEFEYIEQSDTRVVMRARPPGSDKWTVATWTIDRARRMGLDKTKTGQDKDNWAKQPQAMLVARCTSELCRKVAANVLIGLPYSSEELADVMEHKDPEVPADTPTRTVRRKTPAYEPQEEPEPVAYPEMGPAEQETVPITTHTRKALMAACNDLGKRSREERLTYVSHILGRTVATTTDLSETEGQDVVHAANAARHGTVDVDEWPPVVEVAP